MHTTTSCKQTIPAFSTVQKQTEFEGRQLKFGHDVLVVSTKILKEVGLPYFQFMAISSAVFHNDAKTEPHPV